MVATYCQFVLWLNHEEADTRILFHAAHCANNGDSRVMVRTVDIDVVVLSVACFQRMSAAELWLAFGSGKHLRNIAIHELVSAFGADWACALLFFHAFTCCDTVSCFVGRGKKTSWETWNAFSAVTDA